MRESKMYSELDKYPDVLDIGIGNTYGGLKIVSNLEGEMYLKMEDCVEGDFYGPLTREQIEALQVISKLEPIKVI